MNLSDLSVRKKLIGGTIFIVLIATFLVSSVAYVFMRITLVKRFEAHAKTASRTILEICGMLSNKK